MGKYRCLDELCMNDFVTCDELNTILLGIMLALKAYPNWTLYAGTYVSSYITKLLSYQDINSTYTYIKHFSWILSRYMHVLAV